MRKMLVATASLLSSPALAEPDWRMVATTLPSAPHFIAAYVDIASLRHDRGALIFWVDYIDLQDPKHDEDKELVRADCSSKYVETLQTEYYLRGKNLAELGPSPRGSYAVPASMIDSVIEATCWGNASKMKSVPDPYAEERGASDAILAALIEGVPQPAHHERRKASAKP